jgi:hypothetical protein
MITIEHVEELIKESKSSYFFRHSCATDADKRELAQKILDEIIAPLTDIADPKPKYDEVQVELPFGTTVKGGVEFVEPYYQTMNRIMEDFQ